MVISRLNQLWLSDITYIRIWTGFVYLAAILAAINHFSFKQMSYLWGILYIVFGDIAFWKK